MSLSVPSTITFEPRVRILYAVALPLSGPAVDQAEPGDGYVAAGTALPGGTGVAACPLASFAGACRPPPTIGYYVLVCAALRRKVGPMESWHPDPGPVFNGTREERMFAYIVFHLIVGTCNAFSVTNGPLSVAAGSLRLFEARCGARINTAANAAVFKVSEVPAAMTATEQPLPLITTTRQGIAPDSDPLTIPHYLRADPHERGLVWRLLQVGSDEDVHPGSEIVSQQSTIEEDFRLDLTVYRWVEEAAAEREEHGAPEAALLPAAVIAQKAAVVEDYLARQEYQAAILAAQGLVEDTLRTRLAHTPYFRQRRRSWRWNVWDLFHLALYHHMVTPPEVWQFSEWGRARNALTHGWTFGAEVSAAAARGMVTFAEKLNGAPIS